MNECRRCGTTENLTKHHLVSKSKLRELGNRAQSQAITIYLCRRCHSIFHGHRNWITKEMKRQARFEIFIKLTTSEIEYIIRTAGRGYLYDHYTKGWPGAIR